MSYIIELLTGYLILMAVRVFTEIDGLAIPEPFRNFMRLPYAMDEDDVIYEYGKFMKANMNFSMSPCEDFYEYACGNYKNNEYIPESDRNSSTFGFIQSRVDELIQSMLVEPSEDTDKSALAKAKRYYQSCEKMTDMKLEYAMLLKHLEAVEESFVRNPSPDYNWVHLNAFGLSFGIETLLPMQVMPLEGKYNLLVHAPQPYFKLHKLLNAMNISEDLGIPYPEISSVILNTLRFEEALVAYNVSTNKSYKVSFAELQAVHPNVGFSWMDLLNTSFNGSIEPTTPIYTNILNFKYLTKFISRTDRQTVYDYVKLKIVMRFYTVWKIIFHEGNISKNCVHNTAKTFEHSIVPWFVSKTFNVIQRADMLKVAQIVRKTFYTMINGYDWLDEDTKSEAKAKLNAMDLVVGFTDDMMNVQDVNEHFEKLEINSQNFFENLINLQKFVVKFLLKVVGKAVGQMPYDFGLGVNAFYALEANAVKIHIPMSQLPFYNIRLPTSVKFGGVGSIIAHEIVHGYDILGRKFNYNGDLSNWWSNSSLRNFKERYHCLEAQYNHYDLDGVRTNGTHTLSDNMADNGGTRIAYFAYLKWMEDNKIPADLDRRIIPDMSFTNKQLFFLQFAQNYCQAMPKEQTKLLVQHDEHALHDFRVRGTLSNMKEFSEEFQCPLGSNMNPLRKCIVW